MVLKLATAAMFDEAALGAGQSGAARRLRDGARPAARLDQWAFVAAKVPPSAFEISDDCALMTHIMNDMT